MPQNAMPKRGNWQAVKVLGEGGGGTVYKAIEELPATSSSPPLDAVLADLLRKLNGGVYSMEEREKYQRDFLAAIKLASSPRKVKRVAALKILHIPKDPKEAAATRARLNREVSAMSKLGHPNIIKLTEVDPAGCEWFVMEFMSKGMLHSRKATFTGKAFKSLHAIRPLVEGLIHVHEAEMVHRDIKPKNIFVAQDGRLVLGDFGIVYAMDDDRTRLTDPDQTMCSKDWVPPWRKFRPLTEYEPVDDIHMVGKVLYWMLSPKPNVDPSQLDDEAFDLRRLLRDQPSVYPIQALLERVVVTKKDACLPSAVSLLREIDRAIVQVSAHAHVHTYDASGGTVTLGGVGMELLEKRGAWHVVGEVFNKTAQPVKLQVVAQSYLVDGKLGIAIPTGVSNKIEFELPGGGQKSLNIGTGPDWYVAGTVQAILGVYRLPN